MSTGAQIPRYDAIAIFQEIAQLLDPVCERIELAGSLRRGKPVVGDIEIVCVPKLRSESLDLFGSATKVAQRELELVDHLVETGVLEDRLSSDGKRARGEKFQRMRYKGVPVDIFAVIFPAQWGVIMTIRTGPADFSQRLVTPKPYGMMPLGMRVKEGALYDREQFVETPTELSFFEAIGLPYSVPEERG